MESPSGSATDCKEGCGQRRLEGAEAWRSALSVAAVPDVGKEEAAPGRQGVKRAAEADEHDEECRGGGQASDGPWQ